MVALLLPFYLACLTLVESILSRKDYLNASMSIKVLVMDFVIHNNLTSSISNVVPNQLIFHRFLAIHLVWVGKSLVIKGKSMSYWLPFLLMPQTQIVCTPSIIFAPCFFVFLSPTNRFNSIHRPNSSQITSAFCYAILITQLFKRRFTHSTKECEVIKPLSYLALC